MQLRLVDKTEVQEVINIKDIDGSFLVSSREVAINFEKRHADVIKAIEDKIKVNEVLRSPKYFIEGAYLDKSNRKSKEYLMTRDGFSFLVMGFNGVKADIWKLKYIEAFNKMEEQIKENKPSCIEDVLISSLQEMKAIKQQLNQVTYHALSAKAEVKEIREIVQLDTTSWRRETQTLIAKIAINQGGFEHINLLKSESYELLNKRFGVKLDTRLTNKRRRMAEQGVSKSKRDRLNYLDVIEEDKKLIEGYVAIVKDMAIKYGISKN